MESVGSYSTGTDAVLDDMNSLGATELRLGLPGTSFSTTKTKRPIDDQESTTSSCTDKTIALRPAKSQVVGWPPVQAFRKNSRHHHPYQGTKASSAIKPQINETVVAQTALAGVLVKVSMDGAPYLRKIDLGAYHEYKDLRVALDAMFRPCSSASLQHLTYEDKDGDWMLVGDVPWEMFVASCKRLRIMKAVSGESSAGSVERLRSDNLTLGL